MRRSFTAFAAVVLAGSVATAQQAKVDLAALPQQIKSLDWKSVDWAAASPLEQARSLMLLDQTLEEIGAQMTAEADLMSQYIDQANLGTQFVNSGVVDPGQNLSLQDGEKIALALLRGPMATSSYATSISDAQGSVLTAYTQMYSSTCNRKWSGAMDARMQVRAMSAFLTKSGKMADFNAWVPGEVEKRTKEHDAQMAAQRAAAAQQQQQAQEQRIQQQQQQLAQQRGQLQQQEQQQQAATMQMQQAMAAASQSGQQSGGGAAPAAITDGGVYPNWYYGGLGYAGTGAWYRDAAYRGAACARTEARVGAWHGGGRR